MKKSIILVVLVGILILGCTAEKPEKPVGTTTTVQVTTTVQKPSQGISTLLEMYNSGKMYHGKVDMEVQGKKMTTEVWFYYDGQNRQQLVRAEGEGFVMITKTKYQDNKAVQEMYVKAEQMPQNCDWLHFKKSYEVKENVESEPVDKAFEATMKDVEYKYNFEFVDADPSLFEIQGKVCEMGNLGMPGWS